MNSLSSGTATRERLDIVRGPNGGAPIRHDLRPPQITDILQREEAPISTKETRRIVGGRTVLVTGAGGSIGGEICRQIAAADPRRLLLLDKSENGLFYAHLEVSEMLGSLRVKPFLADLLDRGVIDNVLRTERPEILFHAAAHKHVTMLELHPQEAIRNNVLGTRNIGEAAIRHGVERFVNISTDKAVEPRSYMGLSKRITELCIREFAGMAPANAGTRFSSARFGNVAGTTGSVVRLFWDQIQKGGPVKVTDPRAVRYFMSAREAVHLILRAADLGRCGETFLFDMGTPLNIWELARTMIACADFRLGTDIRIEFTGLREGEKLNESLWEQWERPLRIGSSRILAIRKTSASALGVLAKVREMEELIRAGDDAGLLCFLEEAFPDFARRRARPAKHPTPAREVAALASMGAA